MTRVLGIMEWWNDVAKISTGMDKKSCVVFYFDFDAFSTELLGRETGG
jgi:hypothetical protein